MAEIDMDAKRKQRIAKWVEDNPTYGCLNPEGMLLVFWKFLDECEVERQRQ